MIGPNLHKFEDDLGKRPGNGVSAPPRAIRAKDLDENNRKLTIIAPKEQPPRYFVEYTREGTRLKIQAVQDGTNVGDILYWDGTQWVTLSPPSSSTMHVLTITSGNLAWTATVSC